MRGSREKYVEHHRQSRYNYSLSTTIDADVYIPPEFPAESLTFEYFRERLRLFAEERDWTKVVRSGVCRSSLPVIW